VSAAGLRSALAAMQVDGEIESHGLVAVLRTASPEQLADEGVRTAALEAATEHGFRTLAVELPGPGQTLDSQLSIR
jgi:hypothetical protein